MLILRTNEKISTKCLYYIKINLSLLICVSLLLYNTTILSLSRFALLKILQKFGSLERFDYLYHKAGPDMGKPRGYCFVSYLTRQVSFEYRYTLKVDICSFFFPIIVRYMYCRQRLSLCYLYTYISLHTPTHSLFTHYIHTPHIHIVAHTYTLFIHSL